MNAQQATTAQKAASHGSAPLPHGSPMAELLARLRGIDVAGRAEVADGSIADWSTGVRFAASSGEMEEQYYRAVRELVACIRPAAGEAAVLHEGGVYLGCWLESTGTISAELLSRFMPRIAEATFAAFATRQRVDGLLPYKLTADGPAFAQIQLVTPPARSVWNHYVLNGRDEAFLRRMHGALARYDAWLAEWRDTRGTGGVEAFCTYDTGHDLSPRFWHMPDSPHGNDPKAYREDNPLLPLVAPDLTATVACQRAYLARMAEELGEPADGWREKAAASEAALFTHCYDPEDGFFYDLDRNGRHMRVQSDVLLRVLACEVGDDAFFAATLERYLLNSRKFFAKYPFTSIALDDPRYDPAYDYNSWGGPSNFLSLIRAPHAFELHHRHVELTWAIYPTLSALFKASRFAQALHPFSGREGFTELYSPAILCLLDFVERLCGILPRPDGTLWFTGLVPYAVEHRDAAHATAYGRTVDGRHFELLNTAEETVALRDGEVLFRCPKGIRVVTDRTGEVQSIIGMSVNTISGQLETAGGSFGFSVAANEQLGLEGDRPVRLRDPGLVLPTS